MSASAIRSSLTMRTPGGVWDATAYLVTDLVVAIPAFTVIVTALALTVGLLITFILAVPCAWALVWVARGAGVVERWRLWAHFGIDVPDPHRPVEGGWFARLRTRLRRRATWREIAHAVASLPMAAVGFAVAVGLWAAAFTLLTLPLWLGATPSGRADLGVVTVDTAVEALPLALLGLVLLPAAAVAVVGLARLRVRVAVALLAPRPEPDLRERVATLEATRSRAVDAAEAERRRIERDLHDGAQQRLVALAMDLGLAREKLDAEPEQARALIDEAHDEAKRAITELRDLARGIHPAVLADRGLAAALAGVVSRSPVPATLEIDVPERLPQAIEGIAYFVVNEALANVAKHSGATTARVGVTHTGARLLIEVRDDGAGGADPAKGTGLTGLADRVAAVDGWMHVVSPPGGPTTLTVELPCAS